MSVKWLREGGLIALSLIVLSLGGCGLERSLHPPALAQTDSGGRLAYIGGDGNVYVTTAGGGSTIAVTDDAEASAERQGYSYHRISWSPHGRLAYAGVNREGEKAQGQLFVAEWLGGPAQLVAENSEHFISYIYWSPASCPGRPACQRLAYLTPEDPDLGTGLHLVEIDADGVEDRVLAIGRPFCFSWSEDGGRMVWHTGGTDGGPRAQATLYDVERDRAQALSYTPAMHLAPAWSASGEDWMVVSSGGGWNQLESQGPDGAGTLMVTASDEIMFSWSPTGEQVAYAARERHAEQTTYGLEETGLERVYGAIYVYDRRTGQSRQVTAPRLPVLGFSWAPDGQRLAYLARINVSDTVWAQWRTVDPVSGAERGYTIFHPGPQMRSMIRSLTQYALSHRFWSPDGRYLTYADRDEAYVDRVWLVDTWAEKGAEPILVAKGVIGVWSWH